MALLAAVNIGELGLGHSRLTCQRVHKSNRSGWLPHGDTRTTERAREMQGQAHCPIAACTQEIRETHTYFIYLYLYIYIHIYI